jgi:peptidoglycan/LPS O-acetylase OafA/YrhL
MALFVVVAHAYWIVWPFEYGEQPSPGLRPWLSPLLYSRFAITVFIVLSAFCLSLAVVRDGGVLRGGAGQFFRGRARRVLPPFFAGVLFSLVLIWTLIGDDTGTHWDPDVPVGWQGYLGNLLLVQNLVGAGQLNAAYWSIGAEVQLYLLFPLLVLVWRRVGVAASTALGIAVGFAGVALVDRLREEGFALPAASPVFVGLFALGMLGAALSFSEAPALARLRERVPWTLLGIAASAAIVVLIWRWSFVEYVFNVEYADFLGGVATLAFLVAASRAGPSSLRSILSVRALALLGTFSFSIYLVHLPLLQVEWQYAVDRMGLSDPMGFLVLATAGTAGIVGIAYLFHLAFERPFMSSRQRRAAGGEFVETGPRSPRREPQSDASAQAQAAGRASTAPGTGTGN